MTAIDPQRPIRFLQTGQSAKSRFCELECSEAAIGDLNLPAMTCRWRFFRKADVELDSRTRQRSSTSPRDVDLREWRAASRVDR